MAGRAATEKEEEEEAAAARGAGRGGKKAEAGGLVVSLCVVGGCVDGCKQAFYEACLALKKEKEMY